LTPSGQPPRKKNKNKNTNKQNKDKPLSLSLFPGKEEKNPPVQQKEMISLLVAG